MPNFINLIKERKVKLIIFLLTFVIVLSVYLYSMAPTASFWDCGELIAVSVILGIPHPPGTPLFVMIGRIFSFIPTFKEPAARVGFFTALFGALSAAFIYLIVMKLLSLRKPNPQIKSKFPFLPHLAGIVAALFCAFGYSFWDNSVEAEVYTPCVMVALVVTYMAMLWRNKVEKGVEDNRLVVAAIYLLVLAAGIHFTPMMILFPLLIYALVVDRKAILELKLIELILLFLITVVIAGLELVDYLVLFLASPSVALIDLLRLRFLPFIIFVGIYGGYLYYLHSKRRLDLNYVTLGIFLIILASTVQLFLMVRARSEPSINEVNPAKWEDFVGVLKREQYDPMRLLPRKTQFLTEDDYRNYPNSYPAYGVATAFFEQIKFYLRYFFWQWGNERFFDIFLKISWPAILGLVPIILGFWGMWFHYKHEKKSFLLYFLCFLIASLGLITYLNLKYSPTDPRDHLRFREVRERDYFFAFSYVFFTIFIGMGITAFFEWFIAKVKFRQVLVYLLVVVIGLFPFTSLAVNYQTVTRRNNWIPEEYGYNMLASCEGKSVLFTNGDNDTFPLWFVQEVPTRVAGYKPFGKNVAVANLSLLNTHWYVKQLKKWGAPISFSFTEIDRLPQGFVGKNRRTFLLKDIMIRDILATNTGIKLKWPDDYASPADSFMDKVFANYQGKINIYFATTVSRDNLLDVEPYLRLHGLVNLVVSEKRPGQVDVEKTRRLFEEVYVMKSMMDPKVYKDENTRGLFTNYAASYLSLALEYQKMNDMENSKKFLKHALSFDLEPVRKVALYYHIALAYGMSGDYQNALVYLDSIETIKTKEPEIVFRLGMLYEQFQQNERAEKAYQNAMLLLPNRPEPVQSLYRLYLERMHDTLKAKGVLENWLRRNPNDTIAQTWLKALGP